MRYLYALFLLTTPLYSNLVLSYPFPPEVEEKELFSVPLILPAKEAQTRIHERAYTLEARLKKKVFGQDQAVEETAAAILRYAAGINDTRTVIAALLFSGPSGVGKTELAKQLCAELYGDMSHFVRINMSEFSEAHTISRLIGSPPGYIGYGQGGQLSNALLKNPYSIVLLDEIEKGHPKVLKMFLHIFDEGVFTSSEGQVVDCRSAVFICTSNILASEIATLHEEGFSSLEIGEALQPYFITQLSPELFNRLNFIVFAPLSEAVAESVINRLLDELRVRVKAMKGIHLTFHDTIIRFLLSNGVDPELGARPLKRLIDKELSTVLAKAILEGNFQKGDILKCAYLDGKVLIEWISRIEKD